MSGVELAILAAGLVICIGLTVFDLRELILPDPLCFALAADGVAYHVATGWQEVGGLETVVGALIAAGSLYGLRAFFRFRRGVEALGLGDVKFAGAAGIWLGPWLLPALFAVASIATLSYVLLGARRLQATGVPLRLVRVPFGPGLCLALVVLVAGRAAGLI